MAEPQKFVFPGDLSLSGSTKYWIVLHGDYAKSDVDHVTWRADVTTGAFSGGNAAVHDDGGAWTDKSTEDFLFRVIEATAGTGYQTEVGVLTFELNDLTGIYYAQRIDSGGSDTYGIRVNYDGLNLSSVLIEIRTSSDDISYTAWAQWFPVDYTMRYYQIRITFTRASLSTTATLDELSIVADQPA